MTEHVEVLIQKKEQCHKLLMAYLNTISIFILINGALIKFSLDKNSTNMLTSQLRIYGAILCFIYLVGTVNGFILTNLIRKELLSLSDKAGVKCCTSDVYPLYSAAIGGIAFSAITCIAWLVYIVIG